MKKDYSKTAFTLVELSVVLIIISIFMAGSLTALQDVGKNSKETITKERIDTIYKAIGNHLRTRGTLPCPSPIIDVKSSDLYGIEAAGRDGDCFGLSPDTAPYAGLYQSTTSPKLLYGMVPVVSLGLSKDIAEDGFGHKFSYIVNVEFTGLGAGNPQFKDADHTNIITIKDITSDGTAQVITADAIFVIVSHGANGYGAFPHNASTQNARSSDSYEMDNDMTSLNDYNNSFVASAASSESFDDTVFYKTRNSLISDFNAFSAVICQDDATNSDDVIYGSDTMTWPDAQYGQVVAATGPNNGFCPSGYTSTVVKPTKKCGAFGIWEVGAVDACLAN